MTFPDHGIDIVKHVVPQMKKIIVDTFKASCYKIDPERLCNSFEILGYDFMMDSDFKLNLIEVNTNPCLEESSSLLSRLLPRMLDDAFKLTVDVLFPPPNRPQNLHTSTVSPND